MRKFALFAAFLAVLVSGCASSRITNLTTTRQPRNPAGLYPIEFVWDSNQQSVISKSIKPYVVVGYEFYPMRPALNINDRWETVVPVPADQNSIIYHFKVDYDYRTFGPPQKSSKLSQSYRLEIIDR